MNFLGIGKYDSLLKLLDAYIVLFPYINRSVLVVYASMGVVVSLYLDPDTQYKVKIAKVVCWSCVRMPDTSDTQ
jgi:hypothetical protein